MIHTHTHTHTVRWLEREKKEEGTKGEMTGRRKKRRGELGWFRRGHGKSTVRRYRLTDVRLSVVKR